LSNDTKTVISASMAVVGTISALMLGLLISDASQAFSTRSDEIRRVSADFIRLDRLLRRYGPDAGPARSDLRRYAGIKLGDLFPGLARSKLAADNRATRRILEEMQDRLLALKPADDRRTWLKAQAVQLTADVGETRWFLLERPTNAIPVPVLVLVVFWQTILFASFGLVRAEEPHGHDRPVPLRRGRGERDRHGAGDGDGDGHALPGVGPALQRAHPLRPHRDRPRLNGRRPRGARGRTSRCAIRRPEERGAGRASSSSRRRTVTASRRKRVTAGVEFWA
jgi:hypothetical protein